jgi:hypothetical protein
MDLAILDAIAVLCQQLCASPELDHQFEPLHVRAPYASVESYLPAL